jgi:hypothetical protein
MNKDALKNFTAIIEKLNAEGALNDVILIGSFAFFAYQKKYREIQGSFNTQDVDFYVPRSRNPIDKRKKHDLEKLFEEMGYEKEMFGPLGEKQPIVKFIKRDFKIEFLTSRKRRETSAPLSHLNVAAQALSYLNLIDEHTEKIEFGDTKIIVPRVDVFIFLKYIISLDRNDSEKKKKDLNQANIASRLILDIPEIGHNFEQLLRYISLSWFKKLVNVIEIENPLLLEKIRPLFHELKKRKP